eukprot:4884752-Amphidinium_carterae.1
MCNKNCSDNTLPRSRSWFGNRGSVESFHGPHHLAAARSREVSSSYELAHGQHHSDADISLLKSSLEAILHKDTAFNRGIFQPASLGCLSQEVFL